MNVTSLNESVELKALIDPPLLLDISVLKLLDSILLVLPEKYIDPPVLYEN